VIIITIEKINIKVSFLRMVSFIFIGAGGLIFISAIDKILVKERLLSIKQD